MNLVELEEKMKSFLVKDYCAYYFMEYDNIIGFFITVNKSIHNVQIFILRRHLSHDRHYHFRYSAQSDQRRIVDRSHKQIRKYCISQNDDSDNYLDLT